MRHLADAAHAAIAWCRSLLDQRPRDLHLVLIEDVTGKLSLAFWGSPDTELPLSLTQGLAAAAGVFWSGRLLPVNDDDPDGRAVREELLRFAQRVPGTGGRLFHAHRYRSRGAWLTANDQPPWDRDADPSAPPVVVFYSFKGGVGRSTLLASLAIRMAREQGKRVVIIDGDLDAPGIASAFLAPLQEPPAYGLVDYLIDSMVIEAPPLADYCQRCADATLTGEGDITVVPAGRLDEQYPHRLGRLAFEPDGTTCTKRMHALVRRIKDELQPDLILFDARTGFTDLAGMALDGLGHLHVLCGTASGQTWAGLERVVAWLGQRRLQAGLSQAECVLALTMQPREKGPAQALAERFHEAAWEVFTRSYYLRDTNDGEADGAGADLREAAVLLSDVTQDDDDAWHRGIAIDYEPKFVAYAELTQIADDLLTDAGHARLHRRILARLWPAEQDSTP